MSTGIETWTQNLSELGPLYPFVGTEMLLALIGLGSWVVWHILQIKRENEIYKSEADSFRDKERLEKAMNVSSAETLVESMRGHASDFGT